MEDEAAKECCFKVENTIETAVAAQNMFDVYDALCGRRIGS